MKLKYGGEIKIYLRFQNKFMKIRVSIFLLLSCISILINAQQATFQKKFTSIDLYIDSLMKDWNIPGLALGIVYKDQLIYAKGYGYRDIENQLPVLATTIFPIASNSKLFTATVASIYADEGKINLDKPVRNYLPNLHFNNDELNSKVTLRDMLSHRTGLPRYDGIWVANQLSRKEMIVKIAYMKPQLGFREGYIYNNMMYAASGVVLENISGKTWEETVRDKIFQPLQMNNSWFSNEEMMKSGNFALAYFEPDSTRKLQKITYVAQSNALGPAGTIKSTVEDMSHWMIAQLNSGKYNNQQAISAAAIKQTLVPNIIAETESSWEELSNALYCLGRNIQTYKGIKVATHTGSIDGYYSNLTFVPSQNIGIFMVHNSVPAGNLRSIMAFPVIDILLNLSRTPWSDRYMQINAMNKAIEIKQKDSITATQVKQTMPSHSLNAYIGKYTSTLYDEMEILLQENQLVMLYRGQRSLLHHFHYDQFITKEIGNSNPNFRLNFLTDTKGNIGKFTVQISGDLAEFIKK